MSESTEGHTSLVGTIWVAHVHWHGADIYHLFCFQIATVPHAADSHTRLVGTLEGAHLWGNDIAILHLSIHTHISPVPHAADSHALLAGAQVVPGLWGEKPHTIGVHLLVLAVISTVADGAHGVALLAVEFVCSQLTVDDGLGLRGELVAADVSAKTDGAHAPHALLGGVLVGAALDVDETVAGAELLVAKLTEVLLWGFGSERGSTESELLGLQVQKLKLSQE